MSQYVDHPITNLANAIWKGHSQLRAVELYDMLDAILAAHEIKAYPLVEQLLHRFGLVHCPRCLDVFTVKDAEVRETVGEMCVGCYNTWRAVGGEL